MELGKTTAKQCERMCPHNICMHYLFRVCCAVRMHLRRFTGETIDFVKAQHTSHSDPPHQEIG